jgi:hypothetical protein
MEVHFNYWHIAGDEEFARKARSSVLDFAEVGVMLDRPEKIDRVCIFLPFRVTAEKIADCSDRLAQPELAQGIFNEVLTTTTAAAPARYVELNGSSDVFCRSHGFIKSTSGKIDEAELLVQTIADGTLLTITNQAVSEVSRFGARHLGPISDSASTLTRIPRILSCVRSLLRTGCSRAVLTKSNTSTFV